MIYIPAVLVISVLSLIICLCCLLAAAVPQWIFITPASITFGLQRACVAQDCGTTNWNNYPVCRSTAEWKDRELIVQIMLWLSFVVTFVLAIVIILALLGKHFLEGTAKMITLVAFCAGNAAIAFVGLMIYVGTMDSWLNCGNKFCDLFPSNIYRDCGYGVSFIIFAIAFVFHVICAVFLLCRWINFAPNMARAIEYATLFLMVIALAFTIGAGATTRWLVVAQDKSTNVGVFQNCAGGRDCESLSSALPVNIISDAGRCVKPRSEFLDRTNAIGALLLVAFFLMLAIGVIHVLRQLRVLPDPFTTMMRIIFFVVVCFSAFFAFVAHFVFAATFNSWLYCGTNFCDYLTGSSCNYGFSLAMGIIALILFVFLMIIMALDLCGCMSACITFTEPGASHSSRAEPYYSSSRTTTVTTTHHSSSRTTRASTGRDDWVYQADSGYYWSDSRHLYWDKSSNQYYNPKTDKWSRDPY